MKTNMLAIIGRTLPLSALSAVMLITACGDDSGVDLTDANVAADSAVGSDAGEPDAGIEADVGAVDSGPGSAECEAITATFVTLGSANADLPEPVLTASCDGDNVVVNSNSIPDFPYIETSPGNPTESDAEYTFPVTPTRADETTAVALIGAIAVAINGIPIFGPTEGAGGDVLALGGGFTECGGHNGPTGYHYHTFDATGSDTCRISEAEAMAAPVLYGYAFDGYPIYSGNYQYTSSYELTDESLFATDTWSAHTYVEGSGDLDECNGLTDDDGNYAYYTTDTFPYVLGCYRGVPTENGGGGGGMMGPGMMP